MASIFGKVKRTPSQVCFVNYATFLRAAFLETTCERIIAAFHNDTNWLLKWKYVSEANLTWK